VRSGVPRQLMLVFRKSTSCRFFSTPISGGIAPVRLLVSRMTSVRPNVSLQAQCTRSRRLLCQLDTAHPHCKKLNWHSVTDEQGQSQKQHCKSASCRKQVRQRLVQVCHAGIQHTAALFADTRDAAAT
jgi:hypothetical protein